MPEESLRKPPFDQEAEMSILGSILQDCANIADICVEKHLYPVDFYVPAHVLIYTAMGEMMAKDRNIDTITISDHLRNKGHLDKCGGSMYFDKLIDVTPTTAHCEHYIDIVKGKSLGRQIIKNCRQGESAVYENEDMELVRSVTEASFSEMESKTPPRSVAEILDEMERDMERGLSGETVEIGLSTGYRCLDALSPGGLRPGSVYWLSGEPGTGKTSLKCNVINNLLTAGKKVADLTLEMNVDDEIKKICGVHCNCSVDNIILGTSRRIGMPRKLPDIKALLASDQFFIADESMVSNDKECWSWSRRMVYKHHVDAIMLDYLQLLGLSGGGSLKIEEQTSAQVRCVKKIAGMLKVPLLVIAEANAEGQVRGSRRADYAGAGHWQLIKAKKQSVEAPDFTRDVILSGKKARYGPMSGQKTLSFCGRSGIVTEPRETETQQEFA